MEEERCQSAGTQSAAVLSVFVCLGSIQLYCGDFSGKDPLSMWGHFSDHYYIKDILRFKFCLSWD